MRNLRATAILLPPALLSFLSRRTRRLRALYYRLPPCETTVLIVILLLLISILLMSLMPLQLEPPSLPLSVL